MTAADHLYKEMMHCQTLLLSVPFSNFQERLNCYFSLKIRCFSVTFPSLFHFCHFHLTISVVNWVRFSQQTHTRLTALFPELPGWAGTRKVKPIWILQKQETVSGSGISWAICKPAPSSRQITMPAPHHSFFNRPDALPAAQPTVSKHWRPHMRLSQVVDIHSVTLM